MKLAKLTYLPRGFFDSLKVLLHSSLSFLLRLQLCKALMQLKWYKWKFAPGSIVEIELLNKKLRLVNDQAAQLLLKEIWIQEVYKPMSSVAAAKVLDLGANAGITTCYLSTQIPNAQFVCLEPDQNNFKLLQQNVEVFNVNSSCLQQAVGLKSEKNWIKQSGEGTLNKRFEEAGSDMEISFVGLEELLLQNFDLVKMDIEGAEWPLLQLIAEKQMIKAVGYWMIELHREDENQTIWQLFTSSALADGFKIEKKDAVWHVFFR